MSLGERAVLRIDASMGYGKRGPCGAECGGHGAVADAVGKAGEEDGVKN